MYLNIIMSIAITYEKGEWMSKDVSLETLLWENKKIN